MPGIVGLVTNMPRQRAERELLQMVESLCHESFYISGTWIVESLGVYVGWVAQKGSFSDPMPLHNERGDVCLVFSGEDFSQPGTARRLKEQGHGLEVEGPSYLVHLYEEDPAFPASLNGRFQGVLSDRTRGQPHYSTIAMGCSESTITSRKTLFISPRKPKRFSEYVLSFAC